MKTTSVYIGVNRKGFNLIGFGRAIVGGSGGLGELPECRPPHRQRVKCGFGDSWRDRRQSALRTTNTPVSHFPSHLRNRSEAPPI
jgi:hypothetical protein